MSTMERCLVTGSSGFLGNAVAADLVAAGYHVVGVDPAPPPAVGAYRHVADDLSDPARLAALLGEIRPGFVIHSGGISGPMVPVAPAQLMAINVAGSINLLRASEAAGVRRFVFCSSLSAVGEFTDGPLPDDAPLQPTTVYGASKAAMDQVLCGLQGRVAMQLCALRLTHVYGAGRRTQSAAREMIDHALAGRPMRVPAEVNSWPYIYIDDAALAVIAAATSPGLSQLFYNIAHPELVSLQDLAAAVRACGLSVELVADASLPIVRRGTVAVAAAARDFGFAASVDHREGVARMLAEIRKHVLF